MPVSGLRKFLLPCLVSFLLFVRCANPVSPDGGPKDIRPPKVVSTYPDNKTVDFDKKEIRITFDEFIQLKDPASQVTISPPPRKMPDFKVRGKTLVVDLADTLLPGKTYSINFGESILDITEGNILKNYRFIFSTGSWIDSLRVKGKVIDAFDDTPQKDILVMLYVKSDTAVPVDSLPLHAKPAYLGKTDEEGFFDLENIQAGPLLLFALKDVNGNYYFDAPNEKIAFLDSLINGFFSNPATPDTLKIDTVARKDTIASTDSMIQRTGNAPFYTLRLFEQSDSVQKIRKAFLPQDDEVALFFRFPVREPEFTPLNFAAEPGWALKEISHGRDSVLFWMMPNAYDSLIMQVSDRGKVIDTVRISLGEKNEKKKKEKKGEETTRKIFFTTNVQDSRLNHFKNNPDLVLSYPAVRSVLSKTILITGKDTIHPTVFFTDSIKRNLIVKYPWKENNSYKLIFPDSTFFSQNNLTNDTIFLAFRTKMLHELGSLKINLKTKEPGQIILQLLDEKENVLDQKFLKEPGSAVFNYLNPGKYKVKCILDRNQNGRWDSGNYQKKLEPEEVLYFPGVIEIRANWDVEETLDAGKSGN
jgi:hypothetical protein